MTHWLVHSGEYGESVDFAMQHNLAVISWDDLPENIQSKLPITIIRILLPKEEV